MRASQANFGVSSIQFLEVGTRVHNFIVYKHICGIEIWGRDVDLISSTEIPNEEAEESKLLEPRSSKEGYNFKFQAFQFQNTPQKHENKEILSLGLQSLRKDSKGKLKKNENARWLISCHFSLDQALVVRRHNHVLQHLHSPHALVLSYASTIKQTQVLLHRQYDPKPK